MNPLKERETSRTGETPSANLTCTNLPDWDERTT